MALEDKENAEQTEKLADMKFLAKMSNKMSTPINVSLGNNDMILRGTRESHTAAYAIGIQAAGKSLSLAVSNIIELMNLDNGTLKLEDAPYSTISLLQDVMSYAEYNAEKKNLEFHLEIDEALPQELSGDTVRLAQVLSNLLSNAIKHTQKGFVGLSMICSTACFSMPIPLSFTWTVSVPEPAAPSFFSDCCHPMESPTNPFWVCLMALDKRLLKT